MNLIVLSATGLFVLLGIAFIALFRQLASGKGSLETTGDLENIFVPSRYKPMERLLEPADQRFLASHPGYNRGMARRFRANRVEIFRGYARCLGRDFARVSNALKVLMIHAPADRSALVGMLVKQRLMFSMNMMSLEMRLTMHSFGFSAPTVDVRSLVEALDAMCAQVRALSAVAQPSLA
jgi:hypothetical protein